MTRKLYYWLFHTQNWDEFDEATNKGYCIQTRKTDRASNGWNLKLDEKEWIKYSLFYIHNKKAIQYSFYFQYANKEWGFNINPISMDFKISI